jgi:hypothetical protein
MVPNRASLLPRTSRLRHTKSSKKKGQPLGCPFCPKGLDVTLRVGSSQTLQSPAPQGAGLYFFAAFFFAGFLAAVFFAAFFFVAMVGSYRVEKLRNG